MLHSIVDARGEEFKANVSARALLADIGAAYEQVLGGGGQKYVERHRARGKLMALVGIELLLDRDSPFLSPLAGYGNVEPLGGGTVMGIGVVRGTECLVSANDPTVRGGSSSPTTVAKGLRAHEIALANRLPVVNLTESAAPTFPARPRSSSPAGPPSRISRNCLATAGVPTMSALVFGPCRRRRVRPRHERLHGARGGGESVPGRAPAGQDGHRRGR